MPVFTIDADVDLAVRALRPGAEIAPVHGVPRLPAPSVTVPTRYGRPVTARVIPAALIGYHPRPVTAPNRTRTRAAKAVLAQAVPAGLLGAADAAATLRLPIDIVRACATANPHLLPPFELINGEPYFHPDNLTGGAQ